MASEGEREEDEARIVRAVLRLARRLRRPAGEGEVTGSALALLATLYREGPMSAVGLASHERLKPQSLSRLLAKLDADGSIERTTDPGDQRRHMIVLTATGRRALRRAIDRRRAWLTDAMAAALDDAGRKALVAAADVMLRLADHPGGDDPED